MLLICFKSVDQKKNYKSQLESMLITHVYPEFQSPLGYMRARVGLLPNYLTCTVYRVSFRI